MFDNLKQIKDGHSSHDRSSHLEDIALKSQAVS